MMTVKEFKDAGLVFVKGDVVVDCALSSVGAEHINEEGDWDSWVIRSFTWRDNTGEKSKFVGDVELMDGENNTGVMHSSKVNWAKTPQAGDANICQWRPHLPSIQTESPEEKEYFDKMNSSQEESIELPKNKSPYDVDAHVSERKPVYTQAMCDAGELPPVGSECMIIFHGDTSPRFSKCTVMYVNNGVGVVNINGSNVCFDSTSRSWNIAEIKPIKTDREKAIDEMYAAYMADPHEEIRPSMGAIYDLGYRKHEK